MARFREHVGTVLVLLLAAAGLWVSYHLFRWQWSIDGDIAGPYVVRQQVLRDGFGALTAWRYAQDNWLFSLTLPDFLVLAISGDSPWLFLHTGWALMLLNSLLLFLILRPVIPWQAAAVTALALLFAGPSATGWVWYLSHPISHNSTMSWGLGSLWLLLRWLRGGHWSALPLAGLALFIGALSDPWLTAAMLLPVILGAFVTAVFPGMPRWRLLGVMLCVLAVMVMVRTRLFTLLWFLPGAGYVPGDIDEWWRHLGWIATYVALLFNVAPISQPGFGWQPPVWLVVVNVVPAVVVVGWSIWRLGAGWPRLAADARFLAAIAAISCGGTGAAFVLSNTPDNITVGRYILNWAYCLPLLVGMAAFGPSVPRPDWLKRAAAAWCALMIAAGVAAQPAHLATLPDIVAPTTRDLARLLDANGLTYGYGPNWGSNGTAVQWLTGGRIVVRPIARTSSGVLDGRIAQTFPAWFEPADIPAGVTRVFFLAAPDLEVCSDVQACIAMAERTWGRPAESLPFPHFPVLVYDHPMLTDQPTAEVIGAAPILRPGEPVSFGAAGAGRALQGRGWSGVEGQGAWTAAREAVLKLHLPEDWNGPATLVLDASGFPAPLGNGPQPVTVLADGSAVAHLAVVPWDIHAYEVTLPDHIAARRQIALTLRVGRPGRPSDAHYVDDVRLLGVYLSSLTLRR